MSNEYSNWDYVAQEPPRGVCMVEGHYIRIYIIDPLDTYSGHYSQWWHTPPTGTLVVCSYSCRSSAHHVPVGRELCRPPALHRTLLPARRALQPLPALLRRQRPAHRVPLSHAGVPLNISHGKRALRYGVVLMLSRFRHARLQVVARSAAAHRSIESRQPSQ